MKHHILIAVILLAAFVSSATSQVKVYRTGGGEIILSGADIRTTAGIADPRYPGTNDVETNMRFTLFFHTQQFLNIDLTQKIGFYTGAAIRNVGFITEDLYQRVGFNHIENTHPNWNKNTKVKRRSYSLGFPIALKVGVLDKHYFLYAGGEYEWMFHYKQKLFLDGNKVKYKEWTSDRVNPWVPSVFGGIQFPGGLNLKFKYYLQNFLNTDFKGVDFGEEVDYSQFESSTIWYISMSMIINRQQLEKMLERQQYNKTAWMH
jgi:hypothetical protein